MSPPMNKRLETLRRLGARLCGTCEDILVEGDAAGLVHVMEDDHPAMTATFGRTPWIDPSTRTVLMCDSCRKRWSRSLREFNERKRKARVEQRIREMQDEYENRRGVDRLIEPNSKSYAREVRRHRHEIVEAMKGWGMGPGLFGGGED